MNLSAKVGEAGKKSKRFLLSCSLHGLTSECFSDSGCSSSLKIILIKKIPRESIYRLGFQSILHAVKFTPRLVVTYHCCCRPLLTSDSSFFRLPSWLKRRPLWKCSTFLSISPLMGALPGPVAELLWITVQRIPVYRYLCDTCPREVWALLFQFCFILMVCGCMSVCVSRCVHTCVGVHVEDRG